MEKDKTNYSSKTSREEKCCSHQQLLEYCQQDPMVDGANLSFSSHAPKMPGVSPFTSIYQLCCGNLYRPTTDGVDANDSLDQRSQDYLE